MFFGRPLLGLRVAMPVSDSVSVFDAWVAGDRHAIRSRSRLPPTQAAARAPNTLTLPLTADAFTRRVSPL